MRKHAVVEDIGRAPRIKHKFDKQVINVQATTTNAVTNTVIFPAATYPCVVMGIVISGSSQSLSAALIGAFQWLLVVVEQGTVVSVPAFNGTSYSPEQQVMCFGTGVVSVGAMMQFQTKTKTGRKLRTGDTLQFILQSNTAGLAVAHSYTIQFFLKI